MIVEFDVWERFFKAFRSFWLLFMALNYYKLKLINTNFTSLSLKESSLFFLLLLFLRRFNLCCNSRLMSMWNIATRWRQTQLISNLVSSWKQVLSMIHQVLAYVHLTLWCCDFCTANDNTNTSNVIKHKYKHGDAFGKFVNSVPWLILTNHWNIIISMLHSPSCNCCFCSSGLTNKHEEGRVGVGAIPADNIYVDLPSERTEATPCPALTQTSSLGSIRTTDTEAEAPWHRALLCSLSGAQFHRLPAKSDAVIAPCAADREPLSPPAPPWFLSGWLSRRQCGCGARNATLVSRRQASEKKMKCFSRYLPYLFRPPSTILSSTCHTEGRVGRRGCCQGLWVADFERVTWMFRAAALSLTL